MASVQHLPTVENRSRQKTVQAILEAAAPYLPAPGRDEAAAVSDEQLHTLSADEKSGMLFYLTGFLAKSPEFQDALTRAYNAQMRSRARQEATHGND